MASNDSPASPPSPPPDSNPDRQTHTTHTINLPYRRPDDDQNPQQPQDHDERQHEHHAGQDREPPKITPIPRISPPTMNPTPSSTPPPPPSITQQLAEGLEGRCVDEFGNVLDWDGTVMGRVEGDLPSMVGRPVSKNGEVLDTDGEVAGHVSENHMRPPPLHQLDGGLRVDESGNIYNQAGNIIGKLNEPPAQKKSQEREPPRGAPADCSCRAPEKPASAPNPSEIYLDVKSTFDGIQLIIKIPTIFNRDGQSQEKEA